MVKRIAIQLFGHMRTFEQCAPTLFQHVVEPNVADGYEIDIFIHTWNQLDHNTISYRNHDVDAVDEKQTTDDVIQKIRNIYHPTDLIITPQQHRDDVIITEKLGGHPRSILGPLNMSYSLYKSSEIRRKSRKKYDWVIVTRPDIYFKKDLKIDSLLGLYSEFHFDIPKNALFYAQNPYRNNYGVADPRIIAGTDLIYFARPENVDIATSLYENFDANIDINDFYCMEVWWMSFFHRMKLQPMSINFDFMKCWYVLYSDSPDRPTKRVNFMGIQLYKSWWDKNNKQHKKILGFIPIK